MEAVKERVSSRNDTYLDQIEFVKRVSVTKSYNRYYTPYYIIGISLGGTGTLEYRNTTLEGTGRDIYVLEPGEMWGCQTNNISYQHLIIKPALLQRIAAEIDEQERPLPHFHVKILDAPLYATMRDFYAHFATPTSYTHLWEMLLHILGHLLLTHTENQGTARRLGWERPAIKRVKAYLDEHYTEEISLEDLARIANLSAFHLTRIFRKAIGLPPHAYQAQLRLEQAKRLLSQGFSVSYVASETGYFDQAHFTHQFKRYLGTTPGNYMKTTRIYKAAFIEANGIANTNKL